MRLAAALQTAQPAATACSGAVAINPGEMSDNGIIILGCVSAFAAVY
jgi:hypothetical protein